MKYSPKLLILSMIACAGAAMLVWRIAMAPEQHASMPAAEAETPGEPIRQEQESEMPSKGAPAGTDSPRAAASGPTVRLIETDENSEASMGLIFGHDRSASMQDRARAIGGLRSDLSSAQINVLYKLMAKTEGQDPLSVSLLNVVKNEAASILMRQNQLPQYYASNMRAMHLDSRYDSIWREYCLQFMGRSFPRLTPEEKRAVVSVLWGAAENLEHSMAGTALTALQLNAEDDSIDRDRVVTFSRSLISDEKVLLDIRVTALQVCAELKDAEALREARQLASSTATPLRLRLSAIGAIGLLGDSSDRSELEEYAAQGNSIIRVAAAAALKRLKI